MKIRNSVAFAAISLAVSAPLNAQEVPQAQDAGPNYEFTIGDDAFQLVMPEGYCKLAGSQLELSQQFGAMDSANVTPVDIQRCGTYGEDYALIKSPRGMPQLPLPKALFLEVLKSHINTEQGQSDLRAGAEQGKSDLEGGTNGAFVVGEDEFGRAGSDEDCVYIAGKVEMAAMGQQTFVNIASCMTVVGVRHMVVHVYHPADGSVTLDELKARSRQIANAITAL